MNIDIAQGRKKFSLPSCAIFFLVIFGIWCKWYTQTHIVITTHHQQCYLDESSFKLKWRHSVEHQDWQEVYQQHGNDLILTQSFIQTFGAGVPTQGQIIEAPQGYIGLSSHVQFKELNWAVSRNMRGEIWLDNWVLPIYQYVDDYSTIHIQVKSLPKIFWLIKDRCNELYRTEKNIVD